MSIAPEEPQPICPVCGSNAHDRKYALTAFSILQCRACDLVYLWPRPSVDDIRQLFERLYTEGEGSVPELKSYYEFCYEDTPSNPLVQTYERWLDCIERYRRPGRLLDVGCGTGLFLSVARRRRWDPFGIDESATATCHAREHFDLDVQVGDFIDFAKDGLTFDVITGWDIVEHARDPVSLLAAMGRSLAPRGLVALSTPNQHNVIDVVASALYKLSGGRLIGPLEKFYIEQHFVYFNRPTLEGALHRAGLDAVHVAYESTDLRRLTLTKPMRMALRALFVAARALRLQNRMFVIGAPRIHR